MEEVALAHGERSFPATAAITPALAVPLRGAKQLIICGDEIPGFRCASSWAILLAPRQGALHLAGVLQGLSWQRAAVMPLPSVMVKIRSWAGRVTDSLVPSGQWISASPASLESPKPKWRRRSLEEM